MKINYQFELDNIIEKLEDNRRLLLHSCCGPCSSYVIWYLSQFFDITVFYYNPCIFPEDEYIHRKNVQKELIQKMNREYELNQSNYNANLITGNRMLNKVKFIDGDYDHNSFLELVSGHEDDPECGDRCHICYWQRLQRTAEVAAAQNFDWFTTTLTVSPYKNAQLLNAIGLDISNNLGISYLVSDFKKKEGYKQSIELSKVYGLYRQDYCGCEFSLRT